MEALKVLQQILDDWSDKHCGGSMRVELRLYNKHTGPVDSEEAVLHLDELAHDVGEAVRAHNFIAYLKELGREIVQE
jgi:hypothetical protein